jgi:putative hydrolase of the HAD superfamily
VHGHAFQANDLPLRFQRAFQKQDAIDQAAGWRTSEQRERQRWQQIVADVFAPARDTNPLFESLWHHFARPESWRCYEDVANCLNRLAAAGIPLAVASNFDNRLERIVAGLPELAPVRWLAISSKLGWRKPAPEFFAGLCALVGCEPAELWLVGDDYENDCVGGRAAGLQALLLDRSEGSAEAPTLRSLTELPTLLPECLA